jgi:acyl carrier protein
MTPQDIWSDLVEAIREEIGDSGLHVEPSMTANDIPGWDSLAHVRIVINVEDRTAGVIEISETYKAATVGELAAIVAVHAGEGRAARG